MRFGTSPRPKDVPRVATAVSGTRSAKNKKVFMWSFLAPRVKGRGVWDKQISIVRRRERLEAHACPPISQLRI